jgi:hypothetical protein
MFDAGHGGGSECVSSHEPNPERNPRRQYTLKGVEEQAISLMRDAAKKEGMKIGSWVSLRLKEAATKSLHGTDAAVSQSTFSTPASSRQEEVLIEIARLISTIQHQSESRFIEIERELHEITRSQRTILSGIVDNR